MNTPGLMSTSESHVRKSVPIFQRWEERDLPRVIQEVFSHWGGTGPRYLKSGLCSRVGAKESSGLGESARRRGGSRGGVVTLASAGQMLARKSQTASGAMQLAERITWGRACRQVRLPVSLPASHPLRADSGPATRSHSLWPRGRAGSRSEPAWLLGP